ncbi:hypothetical protein KGF51_18260 [Clostridioides sp. ZZV14-6045]|uniref:hypothetical protein n=1 Tax=unclassified Clostridioides TaxID=2635829 RepID=UPI001D104AEE|nr:hypothetical protein [Clostridioides sp. ZZV14-6045]MCC0732614.1 hypothetical protein [Clostridioides sp. ZZV14-6048]
MVKTEFVVTYQREENCGKYEVLREVFNDLSDALSFRIEKKQSKRYKNIDIVARCIVEILI